MAGDDVRPYGRGRRVAERPLALYPLLVVEVDAPVVDVREEHRQLDQPALRRRPHRGVGLVARVGRRGVEGADVQVGEEDDGDDRRQREGGTRRASGRRTAQSTATATSPAIARQATGISRSGTRG